MRKINRVMAPVCLAVMAIAHPVLSVWLSPDFANQSINVVIILAVGIYVNSLATVPYTLLHAIGRPMITAVLHCGEVVGYILVLWILTRAYGIEGAAAAWTIRVAVDLALMHHFVNRRINQG
jgi:O-antigen/teichoic acid export membrane protein